MKLEKFDVKLVLGNGSHFSLDGVMVLNGSPFFDVTEHLPDGHVTTTVMYAEDADGPHAL